MLLLLSLTPPSPQRARLLIVDDSPLPPSLHPSLVYSLQSLVLSTSQRPLYFFSSHVYGDVRVGLGSGHCYWRFPRSPRPDQVAPFTSAPFVPEC
ncbi:hypothetical protein E2C01_096987 [Portunus trituberculatus]|uniref:Uncharacterized protein n=1 Tax=Portunus trituberculatus TaxID=210409 RepID=A0A5B7K4I8_PORTR|nr:hypothetical protein [Portunus trituberculatus]